jgi:ribonuclease HI
MTTRKRPQRYLLIHADESCLGNGRDGDNPGGAGALIEARTPDGIVRRDVYISAPATTNNRMALAGTVATFALLSEKGRRFRVTYVSDSEYLVKGMTEWVPSWRARGWKRKGGRIENLELWQKVLQATEGHEVAWTWVRGHAGDAKNEYADTLAVMAATEQVHSRAAEPSKFEEWLADARSRGAFEGFDPDADFDDREATFSPNVP